MAVTVYDSGTMFVPIKSGSTCPICGKRDGRCSEFYLNHELLYISCRNVVSDEPSGLPGWYKHRVDGSNTKELKVISDIKKYEITDEILALRHKVYTELKAIINNNIPSGLYEDDKADLERRGLSDEIIRKLGCFSVPKSSHRVLSDCGGYQIQLVTHIARTLYKMFGDDLLKVPGFLKLTGKNGDYITLKTKMKRPKDKKLSDIRGYFIPYNNYKGQFVGMQYRLSEPLVDYKGKQIRYFWLSSRGASSGSPIDFIVPSNIKREEILLIGEGALKMKIACEMLGYKGMAMAGVTNYNSLSKQLQLLELKTKTKYKVILVIDMDKYENCHVINGKDIYPILDAEERTVDLLKLTDHKVAIAEWNGNLGKGIDDALVNGVKLQYRIV